MNRPGRGFHGLKGDCAGQYAVTIKKNWRITLAWTAEGADAIDIDYVDYH